MRGSPRVVRPMRKLLAAVALACAGLLTLAGPALAGPAWVPPTDLSAPLRDASHVDVAMSDAGETVAIWERQGTSGVTHNLQVSTRSPGGSFSAPVDLALQAQDPELVMTPGGEAVAVWSHFSSSSESYVIQAATRPAGGSFSAPVDVYTLPKNVIAQRLRVAVNATGDIAVSWEEVNPESGLNKLVCEEDTSVEPPKIVKCPNPAFVMASVRPAGGSFSEAVRVSPPRGINPSEEEEKAESRKTTLGGDVAIDSAGDVSVVWSYFDGSSFVAQAAFRPAGGSFAPPVTLSEEGENAFSTDVAMDAAGNTTAVWTALAGEHSIAQASTRPSGDGFSKPPEDLSAPGGMASELEIAMTPTGTATVIWTLSTETGERVIQATTRPNGGDFSAPDDLSSPEEQPLFPTLAMNSSGAAVVAWSGASGPGMVTRAVSRAAGGGFSTPVEVSAGSSECCFHPGLAIDSAGDATAVWIRSDGSNAIAQAAGYDADAPELRNLSIPATGTVGAPVSFSVDPFDVWPIASTRFEFGDGTSAAGTAVSHVYTTPGTFPVTATTVDAAGTPMEAGGTVSILASNDFRLDKVKRNKKTGRATITVQVPGPGRLTLSGKGVKKLVSVAKAAGAIGLTVAPNRRTLKKLNKRHKARVKLTITFAPTGGSPATRQLQLVLVKTP